MAARCRAGCTAMAVSQTGKMTETSFCIRQLEAERIVRDMFGGGDAVPAAGHPRRRGRR